MNTMSPVLAQELIDALHRNTRALEENTAAVKSGGGGGASALLKAGKDRGKYELEYVRVKICLAKAWPNEYGWYKAAIGAIAERKSPYYDTKSKSIAAVLEHANENDLPVTITFDAKINGEYENRYIKTVEIVAPRDGEPEREEPAKASSSKRRAAAPEPEPDEEESPF